MPKHSWICTLPVLLVLVSGCGRGDIDNKPAPVGDQAVLQELAEAYEELAAQMPMNPQMLAPGEKKKFVRDLFAQAGYGYEASLCQMANSQWDAADRNVRDLIELLTMPHASVNSAEALFGIYNAQESACMRAIQQRLSR